MDRRAREDSLAVAWVSSSRAGQGEAADAPPNHEAPGPRGAGGPRNRNGKEGGGGVAQDHPGGAEEGGNAASELDRMASELRQLVDGFRLASQPAAKAEPFAQVG